MKGQQCSQVLKNKGTEKVLLSYENRTFSVPLELSSFRDVFSFYTQAEVSSLCTDLVGRCSKEKERLEKERIANDRREQARLQEVALPQKNGGSQTVPRWLIDKILFSAMNFWSRGFMRLIFCSY